MLSCSIWFSAQSFWMGGGLDRRCLGRVCGADGGWRTARHGTARHGYCRATWLARQHPHGTHDLRSGSQDHHPSKNSVQKTICCNSTSNSEVCHPRCVCTIAQKFCVLHVQSNTTTFHLVQLEYNYMFRVHTPIIRSIRCWVAAYGFLRRVFGWVVVLTDAA